MKNIKTGVDNTLDNQVEAIEKLDKYITKWNQYYNEQNFVNMEYQYNKIEEYLKEVRTVENLHELIKNNGRNFDLTQEEKELATMLAQ